jgi:hypothetical protein
MYRFKTVPNYNTSILLLAVSMPLIFALPVIGLILMVAGLRYLIKDIIVNKKYDRELEKHLADTNSRGFLYTHFIGGIDSIPPNSECIVYIKDDSISIQWSNTTIIVPYGALGGAGYFPTRR